MRWGGRKSIGGGVEELRIDFGPRYRVYDGRAGSLVVILLCGGGKGTQAMDIPRVRLSDFARLCRGAGFDHRDLHSIAQGGENADQQVARYMLEVVVQDRSHPGS